MAPPYTFFFNKQTFDGRRSGLSTGDDWIDYLTADDRRPLNTMADGEEVFIVGLLDGKVRLGERLMRLLPPLVMPTRRACWPTS
jgi:hypothetical protein